MHASKICTYSKIVFRVRSLKWMILAKETMWVTQKRKENKLWTDTCQGRNESCSLSSVSWKRCLGTESNHGNNCHFCLNIFREVKILFLHQHSLLLCYTLKHKSIHFPILVPKFRHILCLPSGACQNCHLITFCGKNHIFC